MSKFKITYAQNATVKAFYCEAYNGYEAECMLSAELVDECFFLIDIELLS